MNNPTIRQMMSEMKLKSPAPIAARLRYLQRKKQLIIQRP
jgi:SOS-response transcriptional repressor LexA